MAQKVSNWLLFNSKMSNVSVIKEQDDNDVRFVLDQPA